MPAERVSTVATPSRSTSTMAVPTEAETQPASSVPATSMAARGAARRLCARRAVYRVAGMWFSRGAARSCQSVEGRALSAPDGGPAVACLAFKMTRTARTPAGTAIPSVTDTFHRGDMPEPDLQARPPADAARHDAADGPGGCPPLFRDAPASVGFKKLRKRLLREVRETIDAHGMIAASAQAPRWLVCLSGGKDSYTLLAVLWDLKWRGLLPVDLVACNLDQGQPGFPAHVLPEFFARHAIPHRIVRQDTYSIVTEKVPEGKTYCSLCSRLRRGLLYRTAREEGCSAIVLGHHRDDALETLFMNLFYGGRLSAMPPKLLNDDGDLLVLRPLIASAEADIARFARAMEFPIIPCDLCGSQDGLQRAQVKAMLAEWERAAPGRLSVMARALANVRPSHLHDPRLFDFAGLMPGTDAEAREEAEPCGASVAMTQRMFSPH